MIKRILVIVMLVAFAFASTGLSFEPPDHMIDNQTDQPLRIYYTHYTYRNGVVSDFSWNDGGILESGETVRIPTYSISLDTVAATNLQDELVFLHEYNADDYLHLRKPGFSCTLIKGPPDSLVVIPPDAPMHGPTTFNMTLQNPSDIDLNIYVNDNPEVNLGANKNIVFEIPVDFGRYEILMLDPYGEPAFTTKKLYETLGDLLDDNLTVVAEVPYQKLVIQNDTGRTLVVNVNQFITNNVEPGETAISVPWYTHGDQIVVWAGYTEGDYFFQERFNLTGNTDEAWAKEFTYTSFQELAERGYRIIIPSFKEVS